MSPDPAEERLRRLLAEARHTEPVPTDLADRLDRVLAGLEEERGGRGSVSVLAARRRRRAASFLVAAAAVVAIGVGVGQLVSGAGSEEHPAAGGDAQAGQAEMATDEEAEALREEPRRPAPPMDPGAVVRPDHFTDDVARLAVSDTAIADSHPLGQESLSGPAGAPTATYDGRTMSQACGDGPYGHGRLVGVVYGGAAAVLAFRPPGGDSQVVELLECGTGAVLRSTTLPVG